MSIVAEIVGEAKDKLLAARASLRADLAQVERALAAFGADGAAGKPAPTAAVPAKALRKAPPTAPATRRGPKRSAATKPKEPPQKVARETPGTRTTPGGRTFYVCTRCGKRTETNPCSVCGHKNKLADVRMTNLAGQALMAPGADGEDDDDEG